MAAESGESPFDRGCEGDYLVWSGVVWCDPVRSGGVVRAVECGYFGLSGRPPASQPCRTLTSTTYFNHSLVHMLEVAEAEDYKLENPEPDRTFFIGYDDDY